MEPRKGLVAMCGAKTLGLITEDQPKEVTYPDGRKGMAWVGVHLTNVIAPIGSPWSSRNPVVLGDPDELLPALTNQLYGFRGCVCVGGQLCSAHDPNERLGG